MASTDKLKRARTIASVMRVLGGLDGVVLVTSARKTAIHNWVACGQFPARYYAVMIVALNARGYTASHAFWGQEGNRNLLAA